MDISNGKLPKEILKQIWDYARSMNLMDYTNHKYVVNKINNEFSQFFTPWDKNSDTLGRDLNEWPKPIWYMELIYITDKGRINYMSFTSKYQNYKRGIWN